MAQACNSAHVQSHAFALTLQLRASIASLHFHGVNKESQHKQRFVASSIFHAIQRVGGALCLHRCIPGHTRVSASQPGNFLGATLQKFSAQSG